jgi:hypothetical protein
MPQQHAVLAQIAGEQAQPGQQPKLPPFAIAVASLSQVRKSARLTPDSGPAEGWPAAG